MLRAAAATARMLSSCARVCCCQCLPTNHLSLGQSLSRPHTRGKACLLPKRHEATWELNRPSSLWSAVFQGHLGQPQLCLAASCHTAVVAAAAAAGPDGSDGQALQGRAGLQARGGPPRPPGHRSRRSSRVSISADPKDSKPPPEDGAGGGSSVASKAGAPTQDAGTSAAPSLGVELYKQNQRVELPPKVQQQTQPQQQQLQPGLPPSPLQQQPQQSAPQPPLPQQPLQQQQAWQQQWRPPPTPAPWDSRPKAAADITNSQGPSGNGVHQLDNSSSSSSTSNDTSTSISSSSSSRGAPVPPPPAVQEAPLEPHLVQQGGDGVLVHSLVAPSQPVSEEALDWVASLDLQVDNWGEVLEEWRAGMATATHPFTKQQVEVLALPYYRHGKLVDMRYLHLVDGRLEASWLAAQAGQPYMIETHLQGATQVVFVGSELEVLLLTATQPDWAVVALTPQTPQWFPCDPQQQLAHMQHQQQQLPEDPRRRLLALQDELQRIRQEYELGQQRQAAAAAAAAREQGLLVSEVAGSSPTGLQLLVNQLPYQGTAGSGQQQHQHQQGDQGDIVAVIAVQEGGSMQPLADALALLLGELHCRKAFWPSQLYASPADVAAQSMAAAAQAAAAAHGEELPALQLAAALQATPIGVTPLPAILDAPAWQELLGDVGSAEQPPPEGLMQCLTLDNLAGPGVLSGWSLLSVHLLRDLLSEVAVTEGYEASVGHQGVDECLSDATVWPMSGLERFADYSAQLLEYWDETNKAQKARSTGWPSLDQYYRVCPGEVTVVTGVPNSGKSEWLDALAINLAQSWGWRFAMCSMEKRPRDHARQLLEKIERKPMLQADYARGVGQMNEVELGEAYEFLCSHFYVIAAGEGSMPSVSWVLEKARAAKIMYGIDGLIIDPYNELDPSRAPGFKEHEHVNQTMAMLRKFARDHNVAVWLVAHPRQFGVQWSGQRPGLQDISGGANFANKADNGIVVHRNWARLKELRERAAAASGKSIPQGGSRRQSRTARGDGAGQEGGEEEVDVLADLEVEIYVEKVRNKSTGSRGDCRLYYDRATGCYYDHAEHDFQGWHASLLAVANVGVTSAQQRQQQQAQQQQQQSSPTWVSKYSSASSSSSSHEGGEVEAPSPLQDAALEQQWLEEQEKLAAKQREYSSSMRLSQGSPEPIPSGD